MSHSHIPILSRQAILSEDLRFHYREATPAGEHKGTVLLIHGFPQSSYQFRLVMQPIAAAGYRVIAPDYTGHGMSSKPVRDVSGFTKKQLAQDLYNFLQSGLGITSSIHLVGHDIGGMIAFAFAMQYPEVVSSIVWGECPLPGTSEYHNFKHDRNHWHFNFQGGQPDLAAWLVQGKERPYIRQFYDRFSYNRAAFTDEVVEHYAADYAAPGALQSAFYV
jgi:pimeloyl-ACP methyl ester carboxylesterase